MTVAYRTKRERLEEVKSRALEVLSRADLGTVYNAAEIGCDPAGIDSAVKVLLAEKLVESISNAKRYAKKLGQRKIGASTFLIAAQENRW